MFSEKKKSKKKFQSKTVKKKSLSIGEAENLVGKFYGADGSKTLKKINNKMK